MILWLFDEKGSSVRNLFHFQKQAVSWSFIYDSPINAALLQETSLEKVFDITESDLCQIQTAGAF